ncbi:hypothetical protein V8C34DRAFT_277926 [Trichoderma compactum]
MAFDLQTYRCQRSIGFRVEVHDENHPYQNCTFNDGDMIARNPWRTGDAQACRDHFRWGSRRRGPFISFFTSWKAALRRQQLMLSRGAEEVDIVAVWLNGLSLAYDAFRIARDLGLDNLEWFRNEVLVHGAIYADSYRILAILPGNGNTKEAALHIDGLNRTVEIYQESLLMGSASGGILVGSLMQLNCFETSYKKLAKYWLLFLVREFLQSLV